MPVDSISYREIQGLIDDLNADLPNAPSDWKFALPTKARLEFALRAGNEEDEKPERDPLLRLDRNSLEKRRARAKEPSAWGICAAPDEVSEWIEDFDFSRLYVPRDVDERLHYSPNLSARLVLIPVETAPKGDNSDPSPEETEPETSNPTP
ncbi:MAG: hypothetical protein IJM30_04415 [Thermoguttaceae bacterium]|nr:hypothetical protein [Thermoguttaceae bacterium]